MTLYQQRYTEQIEVADAATIIERWGAIVAVDVYRSSLVSRWLA
jgi:hypothetical protein